MRFEGTLSKWNDDRGFGFIQPTEGGQELFAHISAFPRDGQRPQLHEKLSFEVTLGQGGKKQAIAIQRPRSGAMPMPLNDQRRTSPAPQLARSGRSRNSESSGWVSKLIALVLVGTVLSVGYSKYDAYQQRTQANAAAEAEAETWNNAPSPLRTTPAPAPLITNNYRCDGRQHCSQMTSCAEATFFLKSCPNTKMDGDMDGIPCEEQWCR